MRTKRQTLGTFICGLAGYLDDFGKLVKGKESLHPMYQSNGQVDKVK